MFPLHFSDFLAQFQFLSMVVYFFLSHSCTVRAAWQEGEQMFVLKKCKTQEITATPIFARSHKFLIYKHG